MMNRSKTKSYWLLLIAGFLLYAIPGYTQSFPLANWSKNKFTIELKCPKAPTEYLDSCRIRIPELSVQMESAGSGTYISYVDTGFDPEKEIRLQINGYRIIPKTIRVKLKLLIGRSKIILVEWEKYHGGKFFN